MVVFLCFCVCLWLFIGMWQCFCVFVLLCVWQCFCARSRHPARPLQLSRKPRHYYQLPKPCSATQYNRDTNYPAIFPPGEDDVGRAVNTVAVSVVASPHMRLDLVRIPCKTISMLHSTLFLAILCYHLITYEVRHRTNTLQDHINTIQHPLTTYYYTLLQHIYGVRPWHADVLPHTALLTFTTTVT